MTVKDSASHWPATSSITNSDGSSPPGGAQRRGTAQNPSTVARTAAGTAGKAQPA
jgi:hypothetical protein